VNVAEPLVQSALLGEAIDRAPFAVFVLDEDMRFLAVNEHSCTLLGYGREELLRMRLADVAASDDVPGEYADMIAERGRTGTAVLLRKDGGDVSLRYRATETKLAGMTVYVAVGWTADVSGPRRLRSRSARLRA
jgi:PAS domain S-box-containing protein